MFSLVTALFCFLLMSWYSLLMRAECMCWGEEMSIILILLRQRQEDCDRVSPRSAKAIWNPVPKQTS